jgi:(5-formylfuran-3-yl)methyl phosphate synthase
MSAVARACREAHPSTIAVAAGYADYRRFGGLDPLTIVRVARASGAQVVMLDTAIKDGLGLFDALSQDEIAGFLAAGHAAGLEVALAGSVKAKHLESLSRLGTDIIGVRGAVCSAQDRAGAIDPDLLRDLMARATPAVPA